MTDSDFWLDLEAKFRALQPSGVPVDPGLSAIWTSGVWNETGAEWSVHIGKPGVREQFKSVAENAAAKYGATRLIQDADNRWKVGGEGALFFWLDLLKRESGEYKSYQGRVFRADGSEVQGELGKIKRVCGVSADYCHRLALRADVTPATSPCKAEGLGHTAPTGLPTKSTPPSPSQATEQAPSAASKAAPSEHPGHPTVDLLLKVVAKKTISIETWASDHRLGRTTVFDWKAARIAGKAMKGRVSDSKIAAIEKAIRDDAKVLGLATRTRSD